MRTRRVLLEWKDHHGLESNVVCARDIIYVRDSGPKFRFEIHYHSVINMVQKPMPDEAGVVAPQHLDIATIRTRMMRRPGEIYVDVDVASIEVIQKCF